MDKPVIYVIGIGPGNITCLTHEAKAILQRADLVIGSARLLELINYIKEPQKIHTFVAYLPYDIQDILKKNKNSKQPCILMSGDVGFYSGAKKIVEQLKDYEIRLIPGISSVNYMSAKIKVPWHEMKILSQHGRKSNLIHAIEHHSWVFSILSGPEDLYKLGEKLLVYDMKNIRLYIGENLSYAEEKIVCLKPQEIVEQRFSSLLVVVIENPSPKEEDYFEILDENFIRAAVPMTKSEVRAISIAKLHLSKDAVFFDIGAGTGSISVQVGKLYPDVEVYAVEKNLEAIKLIEANKIKFRVDNMTLVYGSAPEILEDLPVPTHVLIGGAGGNLKEILGFLKRRNLNVKVVIHAITLETQAKVIRICEEGEWQLKEMMQLGISKTRQVGQYHLLMGQNPISIFVLERSK